MKAAKAQAKESTGRKRPAGKEDEDGDDFSQNNNEDEDSEEADESVSDEVNEEKGEKQTGLNIRIKSAVSSFSLMFRILPSKKHPELWNLAVYRDNKLMGYVEVGLNKVRDLGKKLLELE